MILVDTTVWIDFFANRNTAHAFYLSRLIEQSDDLYLCGIVLTEILQGIRNAKEHHQAEEILNSLLFLDMSRSTYILAADIFRNLRARGITIRKTLDCMIAAVAIENNISLLHNDRDFDPIQKYCGLKIVKL